MIHGGNIRHFQELSEKKISDFSANINPLGFPDWLRLEINSQLSSLTHYPDENYKLLKKAIAKYHGRSIEEVCVFNGLAEAFMIIPRALNLKQSSLKNPCFYQYERGLRAHGTKITSFDQTFGESLIIGHPQNPTGELLEDNFINIISQNKSTTFIIDEAFIDFTDAQSFASYQRDNLIVLRSLTKILAIPGLRLGYALCPQAVAEKIQVQTPQWNVNSLSAHIGKLFLEKSKPFIEETKKECLLIRSFLKKSLSGLPIVLHEGSANFSLLEFLNSDAQKVWSWLLKEKGIVLRKTESFQNLDEKRFLRVALRPLKETEQLLEAFYEFYKFKRVKAQKKTPALMIQGTTSNAGKSIMATALCRILYQDGLKVFPFKSQNMALNSYVTYEAGEIGRAQAVQAQACKQDASILMNPILLKPNCDIGSQVIIRGKALSHMNFKDYFKFKPKAFEEVKKAYDEISSMADVMVIEGAGSPSEVNLKQNDIVNMNMAKYANADVYITSDIDRGGMFASFLGTFDTLDEWERSLVKGLIINRFRGDKSLLDPGMDYLLKYTGVPVIGCVPFIKGHNIPEEDCLEFKSGNLDDQSDLGDRLDIAVIDTPRISNFSDIDALKEEEDVRVRIVRSEKDFENPDIIILCGSKSVMRDLSYLKESGLAKKIIEAHKKGIMIVGICGGYQMLGQRLLDPNHVESEIDFMEALGLLEIETVLEKEKLLGQTKAKFIPWDQDLVGYEIHHGVTYPIGTSVKEIVSGKIGYSNLESNVWGSYLHGIFDQDQFRRSFLDEVRVRKGMKPIKRITGNYNIEKSIDALAKVVRESIDMNIIYKNLGL
ncbi:MAG: cobyric acid synthase [Bacteriovoracaceae bacterium]